MDALIWIDWVIIAIVGISTLISLKRGFVREAMSLVIWVGAFVIARTFHPSMQALLAETVETPAVRLIAAFAILFVSTLIVGALVSNGLARLVHATGLSATDRVLGTVFGLARGLIVVVVALALLRMTPVTEDTWWQRSPMVGELVKVEEWSRDLLGDDINAYLPNPDDGDKLSKDSAMRQGGRRLMEMEGAVPELPINAETESSSTAE